MGIRNKHGETVWSVAHSISNTMPEVLAALRRQNLPLHGPDEDFDVTNWLVIDHQLHETDMCDKPKLQVWLEHVIMDTKI